MKKIQDSFKRIGKKIVLWGGRLTKKCVCGVRQIRWAQARKSLKKWGASFLGSLRKNREAIRYYGVLVAVLAVIATSAYGYKNRPKEPNVEVMEPLPTVEAALSAQNIVGEAEEENTVQQWLQWPVEGEVIGGFAGDSLEWNEMLGQWQTHPAIDIAAGIGEAVAAIADGTVTEVYFDNLYGNTVVIDHGEDRVARYASLNTLQMVEIGQNVLSGDIIGSVGTCDAEESLGGHLHIEFYENGQPVDLSIYLEG